MQSLRQAVHPLKHTEAPDDGGMAKTRTAPDPRLAANLERLMRLREISQSKLSATSKVGQSTISRILAGEDSPTARTLQKLAIALNVEVQEFYKDTSADSPKGGGVNVRQVTDQPPGVQYAGVLPKSNRVPVRGIARMTEDGVFTELTADTQGIEVDCITSDPEAYAVIMRGDAMYPAIRDGWVLVIEPTRRPVPGEYVLITMRDGRKMVKELMYQRGDQVAALRVNNAELVSLRAAEIEAVHAIGPMIPPSCWR
jgi:phage repressor protein C with HTH and peptisase S24 domain